MYFPYVRGRQYELLALRELVSNDLLGDYVVPVVEPVKLSPTLIKTMSEHIKADHPISIIRNPSVGSFLKDLRDVRDGSKEASYKKEFLTLYETRTVIKSIIMQENAQSLLEYWTKKGITKNELLVININRDYLDIYEREFADVNPKYALIPDESTFRRRVKRNRILFNDKFEKQNRNADYLKEPDEFFSDSHLYFKDDGNSGFADYSVIGDGYLEAGFAPYAVAIHIVYFAKNGELRVRHFVSDSNEDIANPAKKFYEAVSKLAAWYKTEPKSVELTLGLKTLLDHYDNQTYPGLGSVKKLSLMHHLELMGKYLSEVG